VALSKGNAKKYASSESSQRIKVEPIIRPAGDKEVHGIAFPPKAFTA
jgi:hypothetical protein